LVSAPRSLRLEWSAGRIDSTAMHLSSPMCPAAQPAVGHLIQLGLAGTLVPAHPGALIPQALEANVDLGELRPRVLEVGHRRPPGEAFEGGALCSAVDEHARDGAGHSGRADHGRTSSLGRTSGRTNLP
jgi:hypothetical protein